MRRGPFHHHHQPARLPNRLRPSTPHHHCRAATRGTLPRPWPTGAVLGRRSPGAVRCHRLYGDIIVEFAPDKKPFSARTCCGQRGSEDRSVIPNLTLSNTREPLRRAPTSVRATCMRAANGLSLPRSQPRFAVSRRRMCCDSSGNRVCCRSSRATRRAAARAARNVSWRA